MKLAAGIATMAVGLGANGAHAAEATRTLFGTTPDGVAVEAITLTASHGISARVISYGATLQALLLPDRMGRSKRRRAGLRRFGGLYRQAAIFRHDRRAVREPHSTR